MQIVEVRDPDFAAMLRGDREVRPGLLQPPGGVDERVVLAHVRAMAARLQRSGHDRYQGMMVDGDEVVGLCGFKAPPSSAGEIEIGYGVAAARRRRGHASAAVGQIVHAAQRDALLSAIVAMTDVGNHASERVLARNGFDRVEQRREDGQDVWFWRRPLERATLLPSQ